MTKAGERLIRAAKEASALARGLTAEQIGRLRDVSLDGAREADGRSFTATKPAP